MLIRCPTFTAATIILVLFGSATICSNGWNAKPGKCFFIWKETKHEPRLMSFCCDLIKWAKFSLSCGWVNESRIQKKACLRSKSLKSNKYKCKKVNKQWKLKSEFANTVHLKYWLTLGTKPGVTAFSRTASQLTSAKYGELWMSARLERRHSGSLVRSCEQAQGIF